MLSFFEDFDHQDACELRYGEQQASYARLLDEDLDHRDQTMGGDWSPEWD